ncbi:MAG: 2-amino-4-hydroxy-6-hydroxymethyldihydropteridine diphosphokinase [Bacteroidales bacterium]|jgi:2-amino-4-hydroxy-6-hydroxymethyldihydropteridine diphosphokinase|nr:2-amino-4-hydroxy-6-hydroxymethyldihydropteridine diphosphokinase [Bacteroidales bacterium]MCK9498979.1 2-amino-4-hydroxy-6-hydroxymethyldihydropteridine diphosphokinase [Bacteroidales bacterium]MDY0313558.1 2-amino-4-hydroxy-6-hydroxymethyldihydropteridine diphosphokinase [Bacteroidales bacterium]NLB86940.1 2-amino-4-hydroxy-6-hydroxymethyldihydropteridine diphosphokinase [Bacteroidales bacterium]NLB87047.1 2-amino-4-hydroxy-6-hydroxymethyldihydropteridine diphosphokinase [Bacteroidales bac
MNKLYLGIGGNLGNRIENIQKTLSLIAEKIGKIEKLSSIYLSEAWGFQHKKYFTNIVIKLNTEKSPEKTLKLISEIELKLKRIRNSQDYEGRTMDIDILFYNNEIIKTKDLIIPHPHIQDRLFVLLPLSEIEKDLLHPIFKKTSLEILKECEDKGQIRKLNCTKHYEY